MYRCGVDFEAGLPEKNTEKLAASVTYSNKSGQLP
jgi:hypothetical protein